MAGYHPVFSLWWGEKAPDQVPPSHFWLQWDTARERAHLSSEFPAICTLLLGVSPWLQGGPSWSKLSCDPMCSHQILHTQCWGHWLNKGQRSVESGLGNLNLNHCKSNHLGAKFLPQREKWGEIGESHMSLPQLFIVPTASLPSQGVCSSSRTCPSLAPSFSSHKLIQRAHVQ